MVYRTTYASTLKVKITIEKSNTAEQLTCMKKLFMVWMCRNCAICYILAIALFINCLFKLYFYGDFRVIIVHIEAGTRECVPGVTDNLKT